MQPTNEEPAKRERDYRSALDLIGEIQFRGETFSFAAGGGRFSTCRWTLSTLAPGEDGFSTTSRWTISALMNEPKLCSRNRVFTFETSGSRERSLLGPRDRNRSEVAEYKDQVAHKSSLKLEEVNGCLFVKGFLCLFPERIQALFTLITPASWRFGG